MDTGRKASEESSHGQHQHEALTGRLLHWQCGTLSSNPTLTSLPHHTHLCFTANTTLTQELAHSIHRPASAQRTRFFFAFLSPPPRHIADRATAASFHSQCGGRIIRVRA